ncbi:MAG: DUF4249 domain-containing protein [Bacteroidetes bacterium SW_9_63_38]|nr:MAG: DUF4249 domain-containing protein [Bacteroidetes bacterium SW_9_63_38]
MTCDRLSAVSPVSSFSFLMYSFRLPILCVLLPAAVLAGCDTTATPPEDSQVVVESYQKANAPLDTVWLSRTVGAREAITPEEGAVENADVEIKNLDNGNTTPYTETSTAGVYVPQASSPPTVTPQTSYQLQVETTDGQPVTSMTTVPDAFTLENVENTTTVFQNTTKQPSFVIDPPRAESQQYEPARQNVYFFTVKVPSGTALDASELTPFYRASYDADEDSLSSFRINSSGLLNQANFSSSGDQVRVDLPWIGVAFFGTNEVGINLVDDNYYDFLRSEAAQGSVPPGEFPNVIEHVEGGTGIFASYVQKKDTIQVQCVEKFLGGDSTCP